MRRRAPTRPYAICVRNRGHEASLVLRKIYELLPDAGARRRALLRVIDESGEDHLYPAEFFVRIALPRTVGRRIAAAS